MNIDDLPLGRAPGPSWRRPSKRKPDDVDRVATYLARHAEDRVFGTETPPSFASELRAALRALKLRLAPRSVLPASSGARIIP